MKYIGFAAHKKKCRTQEQERARGGEGGGREERREGGRGERGRREEGGRQSYLHNGIPYDDG